MTVANLGLAVDSSTVVTAGPALDKMTAASQRAEAAAERLGRATATASGSTRQLGAATSSAERDLATLAAKAMTTGQALERVGAGAARAAAGMKSSTFNTANIAAQFQDIAVTAQMGMGAMQIGLQQGTQLAAVIASMENPLKGLGAAFLSVISPLSIVVIGLTALAAAGLQMVNWAAVAKGVLNAVAESLVPIAPYAAAAAIGLALLYSPAILAGLGTAIGALGGVATAVWGIATAIYATVGLPALLIAGFIAIVAGAVIWRDELTKMLGVDIVGAAQDGINFIIGAFVGGFHGVQALWANLPAVLGDISIMAAQAVVDGLTTMLNESRVQVLQLLSWVSTLPIPGVSQLASAALGMGKDPFEAPQLPNPTRGAASAVFDFASGAMDDAQGVDYLGNGIKFVQDAAAGAADALRGLAGSIDTTGEGSKKAAKEAKRQAEAYADITRGAKQRIAASELEMQTLGMTTEQINAQRYAQELLNKAANDNIDLTASQVSELTGLGAAMAAAEEAARRLSDIYEFGKSTFSGFFSDLKTGISDGKSLWESLGNAAANALDKIADKALSMAANGLWDMIFGSIMGGISGGFGSLGNGIGSGAGSFSNFTSLMGVGHNANGTDNWRGGLSWVGERGPELLNLPRGAQVIPNGPSMAMAANSDAAPIFNMTANMQVMPGATEADGAAFARGWQAEMKRWKESGEGATFVKGVANGKGRY